MAGGKRSAFWAAYRFLTRAPSSCPSALGGLRQADAFRSMPGSFVRQLKAFQIAKAQRYMFVRPGSG